MKNKIIRPVGEKTKLSALLISAAAFAVFVFVIKWESFVPSILAGIVISIFMVWLLIDSARALKLRKQNENFRAGARVTKGDIIDVSKNLYYNHGSGGLNSDQGRQQASEARAFWKVKVRYYNGDLGYNDVASSELFSVNPIAKSNIKQIDVYYKDSHFVLGNFYKYPKKADSPEI